MSTDFEVHEIPRWRRRLNVGLIYLAVAFLVTGPAWISSDLLIGGGDQPELDDDQMREFEEVRQTDLILREENVRLNKELEKANVDESLGGTMSPTTRTPPRRRIVLLNGARAASGASPLAPPAAPSLSESPARVRCGVWRQRSAATGPAPDRYP